MPVSTSELKSFRKALTRWKEDMNDKADELGEQLAALEKQAGGVKPPKEEKPPKGEKSKGDDDQGEEEEEEDDDDGLF
jgi:ribosomal protein L12E/L44/L45/RPP1/RPP2